MKDNRPQNDGWKHSNQSATRDFEDRSPEEELRHLTSLMTPRKSGLIEFRQKKITSRQFEEQTLSRFEHYEKQRKERILVQKKQQMKSELTSYKMAPSINEKKRSEKNANPLISRLNEIIDGRKIKLENKRQAFQSKEEKEAKECTFRPSINRR